MDRRQARAIIANLDLIHHFANGGDIGHRGMTYDGEPLDIHATNKIVLGNLKPTRDKYYVKLRARMIWNPALGCHERQERCRTEPVPEHDVIPPGVKKDI